MKREEICSLIESLAENLDKIAAWQSDLRQQAQTLENNFVFEKSEALNEVIQGLIKQEKILKEFQSQREEIEFKIKQNSLLPWLFKKRSIINLLKKYDWDKRHSIQIAFQRWLDNLLGLEKELVYWHYLSFNLADIK